MFQWPCGHLHQCMNLLMKVKVTAGSPKHLKFFKLLANAYQAIVTYRIACWSPIGHCEAWGGKMLHCSHLLHNDMWPTHGNCFLLDFFFFFTFVAARFVPLASNFAQTLMTHMCTNTCMVFGTRPSKMAGGCGMLNLSLAKTSFGAHSQRCRVRTTNQCQTDVARTVTI